MANKIYPIVAADHDFESVEVEVTISNEQYKAFYCHKTGQWFVAFGGETFGSIAVDSQQIESWRYLPSEKSGVDRIAAERKEQQEKHGFSIEFDVDFNKKEILSIAAKSILYEGIYARLNACPANWNKEKWDKMSHKSYEERLVLAGAWIAAELDRINVLNQM